MQPIPITLLITLKQKLLLAQNRYSTKSTLASQPISAGLVIVPILPDFNATDTNHIINHSEAKIAIGAKSLLDKIDLGKSPNLQAIITLEDFSLHLAKDENIQ